MAINRNLFILYHPTNAVHRQLGQLKLYTSCLNTPHEVGIKNV